jgi:hypothetical protein
VDRRRAVLDGLIRVPQLAAELLRPLADSDQFSPDQANSELANSDLANSDLISADQFRADESVAAARTKDGASRVAV